MPVSFDLVVWAMDPDASADDVGAAFELCRQGEHVDGAPHRKIAEFYAAMTAVYPDRDTNGSPWAVTPLHVATDHVEMKLDEECPDEVLLTVEELAGKHGLMLFDPQGGTVYPPGAMSS
ncbi:hypothetical protein DFJ67_3736 [Asanoa ferruginea]|jgi:hypothetical protein|uniref:Uncharacterized protein n=1 Tax=Asanoa ferruginea TaxID=53367 RepID=A0A3D9ZKK1_9ACTN|nr:hypothetical protein DFJ67_3736 [Asanoa ferruginea]GIF50928.1 hypothetical protein Afe04nite_54670 [Asanoa ferruginea]